jgi:hypothetical protein
MKSMKRGASSADELGNPPINAVALKLKPAAKYLGNLSVPTMHRLVKRGLLKPNRKLRHLIFTLEELDRFLNT